MSHRSNVMLWTRAEDSRIPANSRRRSGETRRSHSCNILADVVGKRSVAAVSNFSLCTSMCSLEKSRVVKSMWR